MKKYRKRCVLTPVMNCCQSADTPVENHAPSAGSQDPRTLKAMPHVLLCAETPTVLARTVARFLAIQTRSALLVKSPVRSGADIANALRHVVSHVHLVRKSANGAVTTARTKFAICHVRFHATWSLAISAVISY